MKVQSLGHTVINDTKENKDQSQGPETHKTGPQRPQCSLPLIPEYAVGHPRLEVWPAPTWGPPVIGSSFPLPTALMSKRFFISSRNLCPWPQAYAWENLEPGLSSSKENGLHTTPSHPDLGWGLFVSSPPRHSSCEVTCLRLG